MPSRCHLPPRAKFRFTRMGDQGGCEQELNPVGGCPGGYGSVDVFSQCTVAWEPVSAEESDLNHPPGTSRPDVRASATQGVVKPDRATANHAPGAPGKDEALWELVYFFDNMDNPTGAPRKETGDPHFTHQHLVATFMDLILFAHGLAAPRAHVPSRAYEALAPSLTVPRPTQFFQGITEQGYVWQNMPYGIDFTGDIGVYGRSGTFRSLGKAQLGLVCVHAGEPRPAYMTRPAHAGHPAPTQEFLAFSQFVCAIPVKECLCLRHLGHADNHFRSKMIDPTLFQLFWAAGFPTCAGLAADPGIRAYVVDPQPPSPARTAAGKAHASPRFAVGVSGPQPTSTPSRPPHTPLRPLLARQPPGGGTVLPPPAPTGPSSAGCPVCDAVPLWLPVGWPNVRVPDVPDPLLSSPAPTPRLCPTRGQTCVVELPPLRHARSPLPARRLSKWGRSASGGPPGEDAQAVHSTCRTLGGLSSGECECVVARLHGMPAPPQGFLGVVAHLHSLADQTLLAPWDFDPQGNGVLWAHVLISWMRKDMRVAPGSDHRGTIVNMYLELSRTEWWALSDRREVLSEWCKGASMPV
ncbi:hypothetical protein K439DRAFT_1625269 [Ramaria rubella]|nr:hypothetical protein K439DRAFT_1625269 [Ramaria rubella]